MRTSLILGFAGLWVGASLLGSLGARADDKPSGPGAIFEQRCATCHAIPDPAVRMDRVWLDQVNRTT